MTRYICSRCRRGVTWGRVNVNGRLERCWIDDTDWLPEVCGGAARPGENNRAHMPERLPDLADPESIEAWLV